MKKCPGLHTCLQKSIGEFKELGKTKILHQASYLNLNPLTLQPAGTWEAPRRPPSHPWSCKVSVFTVSLAKPAPHHFHFSFWAY